MSNKREEIFAEQIEYIKNERYKRSVKTLLELVPDYFFEIPASSTGKYHPEFSLGAGGLLRHTKVAVEIAKDILSLEYMNNEFTEDQKDLMLISLIFHDSFKSGWPKEQYTRVDHPLLASDFFKNNKDKIEFTDDEIDFIGSCISSHMGQWTQDYSGNEILPKPNDKYQMLVHTCDYLSSRKYLDVKFDNNKIKK